ncbi:tRNA pseudouridine(38-40) synthase TruA [Ferviditalea candida]|uniref:tRNA pseudouridine synthase A n=1 Tax=Ferviditalea candida TaxID=3108399 RepID=A0ABU5ZPU4_9BACL|nr:tRNA pseudouridine(38-40) synthase TruA [Paenibacillaceae bacterium T2]
MRNICLVISYDGTYYCGFQSQPHRNTVQDKLEDALEKLTGEQIKVHSSGRTDTGVHARAQVINFITESSIPIERWGLAMNVRLPEDIRVIQSREVPLDFHSRKSAKRKTYRYTINIDRNPDVFQRHYQLHHYRPLNLDNMESALQYLIGEHDFKSFCTVRTDKNVFVRTIYDARMIRESDTVVHIMITGNGFLYNMVRIIIGTLLQIGEGKRKSIDMLEILHARDRSKAGPKAPAHGLMLWEVSYDE